MDAGWLGRMRWRRRGAWLWPSFAAAVVVDAIVVHLLPPSGESQDLLGAALIGCVLTLIAVVLLSRPLGLAIRKLRPDLPRIVARDYAGTLTVVAVAAALLAAGLIHRSSVVAHRRAMDDAIARAQAWIGDHAPAEFRRNLEVISAFAIEPGSLYRTCVQSAEHRRSYCVIVRTRLPFARSVAFDGYEPNSAFSEGAG